jgi:guanosine-3',5'-bis(diphosphate) 3'-pyrophosphohydrolase
VSGAGGADLVERARRLALAAHGEQRYGADPYRVHLEHVVEVLTRFAHDDVMRAAAWLHDTVEDTPLTLEEVTREVGPEVAAIVAAVTDEPGANRKARKAATLGKLAAASPAARAVKLADRIANVEASIAHGRGDLFAMYAGEHVAFRAALYTAGENHPQWVHLDGLFAAGADKG